MTCSAATAAIGEPLAGTATTCDFWLVVEQPGPYAGREAALSSGLPPQVGADLLENVTRRGGKLALVRRPGKHPVQDLSHRRAWLCRARFPHTTVWTAEVTDPMQLLGWLDVADPGEPPSPAAREITEPVLLVCTHGRRDACCARSGRSLLTSAYSGPGSLWESSHLGGHRFAPVVLELTTGYQHGSVSPEDLAAIAERAAGGRGHLPTSRGHFALSPQEQAVDLAVRTQFGIHAVGGLSVWTEDGETVAEDQAGRRWAPTITRRPLGMRPESCSGEPTPAERFDVGLG